MPSICKICGREFRTSKVPVMHIKSHQTDKETYEKLGPYVPKTNTKVKITEEEKQEAIFGKPTESIEKPLQLFLYEFGISEKELREIVRVYKTGDHINVVQDIKRKEDIGLKKAEGLKDKDKVETNKLEIADALVNKFGFTVTDVSSNPKMWHLKKQ